MQETADRDRQRVADATDTTAKVVKTCSANDCWDQGDVRIMFVGTKRPTVAGNQTALPTQLAPGKTKGARHGLVGEGITAYNRRDADALTGPLLHCPNGLTVPHPEHGDVTIEESGWYAITYQRAFAEELRRQAD